MAKVAEGMAGVVGDIGMGRRQRSELAVEIKGFTATRRGEVRSLLDGLRVSRGRATRKQVVEAKKLVMVRHGEVCSMLKGFQGVAWKGDVGVLKGRDRNKQQAAWGGEGVHISIRARTDYSS